MPSPWGAAQSFILSPRLPLGGKVARPVKAVTDEGASTGNFPHNLVLSLRQTDFQTLRAVKIGPLPCGGHASSATGGAVPARSLLPPEGEGRAKFYLFAPAFPFGGRLCRVFTFPSSLLLFHTICGIHVERLWTAGGGGFPCGKGGFLPHPPVEKKPWRHRALTPVSTIKSPTASTS